MIHKTMSGKQGAVHYWISQSGEQTIVFTHGATMDHGMFQSQWEYFSQRFRVISWDVPLHGQSRPYTPFSLQNAAHELMAILDAEQIRQAHLVGQSMGGYISQIAAAEYPDRVRTFTAVDSSPIQLAYYSQVDRWLLSITPSLIHLYPYATLISTIAKQIALSASAQAYALETLKTFTKAEIAHIMGEVYRGLLHYGHANLRCPILIVYGDRDRTGKVQAYCNRWAAQEKRTLKVIAHAAHNANMDNPGEFNRVLDEFLAGAAGESEI